MARPSRTQTRRPPPPSPSPDIEDAVPDLRRSLRSLKRKRLSPPPPPPEPKTEPGTTPTTSPYFAPTTKNPPSSKSSPRKALPARVKPDFTTPASPLPAPPRWEEVYALVKAMRSPGGAAANAAVDTMGCERLADPAAPPRERRFHTLVALMLSSQTKDTVNAVAMARLKAELPAAVEGGRAGLTVENVRAVEPGVLNGLIWAVGFHNRKTEYIKQTAQILHDTYADDIPPTIAGLTSLPGVGPKMAHLCMSATHGWNSVQGIGVDVHVHRIANLWGWTSRGGRAPTRTPEQTRAYLEGWLPRDRWKEINGLLVGLGQAVCLPVGRRCGVCEVGLAGLCRAADRGKVAAGRRARGLVGEKGEEKEEVVGEGLGKGAVVVKAKVEDSGVNEVKRVKREVHVKEEEDAAAEMPGLKEES